MTVPCPCTFKCCACRFGPLAVLKAELDNDRKAIAERTRDHHALCRATKKRLTEEEHNRIRQTLWSAAASNNNFVAMRQLLGHCLLNAIGRRGEDLRAVQMSMLYMEHLVEVKPADLFVIGATIYTPKERRDPVETLLSWVRARIREDCPIAAMAVYIVYLNDCGELPLLSIIRQDLEELKLLAEQVSKTMR